MDERTSLGSHRRTITITHHPILDVWLIFEVPLLNYTCISDQLDERRLSQAALTLILRRSTTRALFLWSTLAGKAWSRDKGEVH